MLQTTPRLKSFYQQVVLLVEHQLVVCQLYLEQRKDCNMKGRPIVVTRARMELTKDDYCILEAAARTSAKRMGVLRIWPVEDLISVGWRRVFFYRETHEDFAKYGYSNCIREMCIYIKKEQQKRRRCGICFSEIDKEDDLQCLSMI
jgi:hypothetical protein